MTGNLEAEVRVCAIWRVYPSTLCLIKVVFRILDTGNVTGSGVVFPGAGREEVTFILH